MKQKNFILSFTHVHAVTNLHDFLQYLKKIYLKKMYFFVHTVSVGYKSCVSFQRRRPSSCLRKETVTLQNKNEITVIYTSRGIIVNFIMVTFIKQDILDNKCDLPTAQALKLDMANVVWKKIFLLHPTGLESHPKYHFLHCRCGFIKQASVLKKKRVCEYIFAKWYCFACSMLHSSFQM